MRLTRPLLLTAALATLAGGASAQAPAPPSTPEDLLGNIVVVAGAGRALPKIALLPSLAPDMEDVTLHSVVRRDLDLSGEFEVLPDSAAPDGLYLADAPIDVKAWRRKGVEALVRVSARRLDAVKAELRGQVYLLKHGEAAAFDKRFAVPSARLRVESHHLADLLIGALTGQDGGFASQLAFASGSAGLRRVYAIDADGHDARPVSPRDRMAIAPAFGKNGELHFASAAPSELFGVQTASGASVPIPYKASVYGLAFSRDHAQVAVSLGVGSTLKIFSGPDFASLKPASEIGMALHPTFTPSGKLAFVGEGKTGQRVYVDGAPITPDGLFASSPAFCSHPDGVRAVFAVGVGKSTDLVSTGEKGGTLARLTQGQGSNGYPACSPDGRLVAFFSTRASGEGPGLYVMRLDGGRAKRISPLLGDTLRWEARPRSEAVELKN